MATLITKNSSTASSVPTNAQLVQGELAVNVTDKRLYTENASGTVVELGTNPGSAVTHTAGTAGAPAITTTGDTNTGIFFPAADTVAASVGGTERLRLDSSGRMLVGLSSSGSTTSKLQVTGGTTNATSLATAYSDAAVAIVPKSTSGFSLAIASGTGDNPQLQVSANGAAAGDLLIQPYGGNVGIGTSSPTSVSGYGALTLNGTTGSFVALRTSGTDTAYVQTNASSFDLKGVNNVPMILYTNNTEKARITSGGNLLVGTTVSRNILTVTGPNANAPTLGTASGTALFTPAGATYGTMFGSTGGGDGWIQQQRVDSTATAYNLWLQPSGGEVYIAGTADQGAYNLQVNGTGVWGAGAYVNGSDARLKENVQTLTDGLSVVTQLRPVTFQYKADYSKDTAVQPGFIAQEIQQAMAGKDYVDGVVQAGPEYLNVAYQSLIPVLVKAIQEQQAMIQQLQAEVAALKGT